MLDRIVVLTAFHGGPCSGPDGTTLDALAINYHEGRVRLKRCVSDIDRRGPERMQQQGRGAVIDLVGNPPDTINSKNEPRTRTALILVQIFAWERDWRQ